MPKISNLRTAVRPSRRHHHPVVDLAHPARSPLGTSVVNCAIYIDGVRQPGSALPDEAISKVRASGEGFVWIGLHEPTREEFADLAECFGLHPLAVEDAVDAHQRPKLERYDGVLFSVFKTVRYVEHDQLTATSEVVDTGEIMVFTGEDFVITVRHGRHGSLGPLREELEAFPNRLAKGTSSVLHAIADHVVDEYLDVVQDVQDDIDQVETDVFGNRSGRAADAERIYQLKRELLELKRGVAPLARPLQRLVQEPLPQIDPEIRKYFRDADDHLHRVIDQITAFDELLNSILQAHLAQVGVTQNEDMRKMSAWVAIVAVPTMVFGLYGMNFQHMPETHWTFSYPAVLGIVGIACVTLYRGFRRRGWL